MRIGNKMHNLRNRVSQVGYKSVPLCVFSYPGHFSMVNCLR